MGNLLQVIRNIADIIPNLNMLFYALSWMIGLIMVIKALQLSAKRHAMGPASGGWNEPIVMLVIGILFVALPGLMDTLSVTIFGVTANEDPSSIFAYAPAVVGVMGTDGPAREIIIAIVTIVRFVGLIAVMRGLYMLNQSSKGQGQSTFGPGFTFVIAGALAFNFPIFVGVMEKLLSSTGAS
jgi:hypothetical protein